MQRKTKKKQKRYRKHREKTKRFQASRNRRAERYAEQGRLFEEKLTAILSQMQNNGDINSFTRHKPNSHEDRNGKDFSVTRLVDNQVITRSFGVTISHSSWVKAKMNHSDVKQFCFPIGTNNSTVRQRILELFSD